MTTNQLLGLLLALSLACNLAFVVAALAKSSGHSLPTSALIALGTVVPALGLYFAAVAAYH
ncbi:hypothetical protein [Nocardia concava]|uniref:hypothetical protein n=1 Tax=Nocardia concava TaxID=257281 RepID=UPI0002DDE256|nr:hypothetical protein [Nocardia concava]